jgi:hypothetical protein
VLQQLFLLAEASALDDFFTLVGVIMFGFWITVYQIGKFAKKGAGHAAKGVGKIAGNAVTNVYRDHGKDIIGHFLKRR